jgi:hypothetical protein
MSANRRLAVAVVVVGALLLSAATAFSELVPGVPQDLRLPRVAVFVILALAVTINGAIILWHRPQNRIGWVLCASGVAGCAEHLVGSYAAAAIFGGVLPLGPAAAWIFSWLEILHIGPLGTLALLLFPDGRLPSPRWRPVMWSAAAAIAAIAVGIAFLPAPLPAIGIPNPLGRSDFAVETLLLAGIGFVLLALSSLLSALSLLLRYRRSSGIERQQIKWVAFASVLVAVPVVGVIVIGLPLDVGAWIASLAAVPLPTAMTIALIRYRLYDIDVLVHRTVVYGATSAAIAIAFFAGIVALQALLRPITAGSELAIAASTLGSVALFQPIRRRVQDAVDRRFDRFRYDAARTLDAFADRLRDEVDLDTLRGDLLSAVERTMAPAHASVWLRGSASAPVTISGRPGDKKELG